MFGLQESAVPSKNKKAKGRLEPNVTQARSINRLVRESACWSIVACACMTKADSSKLLHPEACEMQHSFWLREIKCQQCLHRLRLPHCSRVQKKKQGFVQSARCTKTTGPASRLLNASARQMLHWINLLRGLHHLRQVHLLSILYCLTQLGNKAGAWYVA